MNTTELVRFVATGLRPRPAPAGPALPPSYHELRATVRHAIVRARQCLLSAQRLDGSWRGRQTSDATLASQLIFLRAYLEPSAMPECDDAGAAAAILVQQLPHGGWSAVPGGQPDVSASVQAYFALKLAGHEPNDERLSRARIAIRRLGGADAADRSTRRFLALFGQIDYECCPAVVPELIRWRGGLRGANRPAAAALAAEAVVWAHRPVRQVDLAHGIRELFIDPPSQWPDFPGEIRGIAGWLASHCEKRGWTPFRAGALDWAERVIREQARGEELASAGFQELVWLAIAMDAIGLGNESCEQVLCRQRLDERMEEGSPGEQRSIEPRLRLLPLRDTATALGAIQASGTTPDQVAARRAVKWLREPQRRRESAQLTSELGALIQLLSGAADGADPLAGVLPPEMQVGGERPQAAGRMSRPVHGNLPTVDRSAALRSRARRAVEPLVRRLTDAQRADGGWCENSGQCGASSADATGVVLAGLGRAAAHCVGTNLAEAIGASAARGVEFLRAAQRADGSWSSEGENRLVHGTSMAVRGLLAAGVGVDDPAVAAGLNWLVVHEHRGGGWGEEPADSETANVLKEEKPTAASPTETAWALAALFAAGRSKSGAALRAVGYLVEKQRDDGQWDERQPVFRDAALGRWYRDELATESLLLETLSRWAMAAADDEVERPERANLKLIRQEA